MTTTGIALALAPDCTNPAPHLQDLGVYGFGGVQLVVWTALVTEDPLLLIGRSGTGKTYLLNRLSEALGLEHRHYNASLIAFDDLVGFPFPDAETGGVRFLETPATVWPAESVLIDEISRCRPEHQNRLFSLIHERRIQGISLERLRYRWAAMNPPNLDQGGDEGYVGSEPLDPALADRFGLLIESVDWDRLLEHERRAIATPCGDGRKACDGGRLATSVRLWRAAFQIQLESCPGRILDYVTAVADHLVAASIRISPRRARLLTRSLLAAEVISGVLDEGVALQILQCSLPQRAWGTAPDPALVGAAHRAAWETAGHTAQAWVHRFLSAPRLTEKLNILLASCPSDDAGTLAIGELLASEPAHRAAAFAFALFPAASAGKLPIGAEGVNDLARLAAPMFNVDGEVCWNQPRGRAVIHPKNLTDVARVLEPLSGARLARARQVLYHCLAEQIALPNPAELEEDFNETIELLRHRVQS
jgi:MoxR-like ATPase